MHSPSGSAIYARPLPRPPLKRPTRCLTRVLTRVRDTYRRSCRLCGRDSRHFRRPTSQRATRGRRSWARSSTHCGSPLMSPRRKLFPRPPEMFTTSIQYLLNPSRAFAISCGKPAVMHHATPPGRHRRRCCRRTRRHASGGGLTLPCDGSLHGACNTCARARDPRTNRRGRTRRELPCVASGTGAARPRGPTPARRGALAAPLSLSLLSHLSRTHLIHSLLSLSNLTARSQVSHHPGTLLPISLRDSPLSPTPSSFTRSGRACRPGPR